MFLVIEAHLMLSPWNTSLTCPPLMAGEPQAVADLVCGVVAGTSCAGDSRVWLLADVGLAWCCEPVD